MMVAPGSYIQPRSCSNYHRWWSSISATSVALCERFTVDHNNVNHTAPILASIAQYTAEIRDLHVIIGLEPSTSSHLTVSVGKHDRSRLPPDVLEQNRKGIFKWAEPVTGDSVWTCTRFIHGMLPLQSSPSFQWHQHTYIYNCSPHESPWMFTEWFRQCIPE